MAEREEEYISNKLLRRIDEGQGGEGACVASLEREEEYLTKTLHDQLH